MIKKGREELENFEYITNIINVKNSLDLVVQLQTLIMKLEQYISVIACRISAGVC